MAHPSTQLSSSGKHAHSRGSPVDVYDIATDIGREFETIIDTFGADALTKLVPKVIHALEQLERLSLRYEREASVVHDLRKTVQSLTAEKAERAGERERFEKELEESEERTRDEIQRLIATVAHLQTENNRLRTVCSQCDNSVVSTVSQSGWGDDSGVCEDAISAGGGCSGGGCSDEVVSSLRAVIERQRDQLSSAETCYHDKCHSLEQTREDLERAQTQCRELRRRLRSAQLLDRRQMEQRRQLQLEAAELRRRLATTQQQLAASQHDLTDGTPVTDHPREGAVNSGLSVEAAVVASSGAEEDATRPRFTVHELRAVLYERNELKARLSDMHDELALYRPTPANNGRMSTVCPPSSLLFVSGGGAGDGDELDSFSSSDLSSPPSLQYELDQAQNRSLECDEEAPVQGPLPKDPDDAPWKRHESGIRRLFRRLFGVGGVVTPSPGRSSRVSTPSALPRCSSTLSSPRSSSSALSALTSLPHPASTNGKQTD